MASVKSGHASVALLRHHGGNHGAPSQAEGYSAEASDHRHRGHAPRLPGLWHFSREYLLLLPLGASIALLWVNLAPESYFRTTFRLDFLVNDVAMVLFFGLIMKEVAEATAPGGVLHSWRRVMLPLIAALGLTIVPALAYVIVVPVFDEPRVLEGWPMLFAVDLACGYLIARLIFGKHPVIPFFILLAIAANALGIIALVAAGGGAHFRPQWLILMAASVAIAYVFRRMRVKSFWPYVLVGGGLSWCALYFSGFQPALALVPIVPFLPHARRDPGFFVDAAPGAHDALSRFEVWCRHPAQIALFLFGLVNAGVPLKALYLGTWSLPLTMIVARPVGLLVGVGVAVALRLHLPHGVTWRDIVVVGFISTIGFTMALFFATAAVGAGPTLSELKMGALLSVAGAVAAFASAAVLRTGTLARRR
jgi:NhaA family Na+:H+ antiporter